MAITCIPNQAVNFCTPSVDSCGCFSGDWCTPVEQTDTTMFQVELTESDGVNILTTNQSTFNGACGDPSFWTCGGDWAIAANVATYTNTGAATDLTLDLTGLLSTGVYYKVKFDIAFTGAGLNTLKAGYLGNTAPNNTFVNDFDITGTKAAETITKYIYLDASVTDELVFRGDAGTFELQNIELLKMSTPNILIKDDDGNTVYTFARDKYNPVGVFAVPQTNQGDTRAFITKDETGASLLIAEIDYLPCVYCTTTRAAIVINWGIVSLSAGCYTICLQDTTTLEELNSNCFNLQTNHDCSHEITFNNNSDHFNLYFDYTDFYSFSYSFAQSLRICSRLDQPSFDAEGDLFTDDAGTATLTYAKKTETLVLQTEPLPEFIHDALSNAIIHDNFFIDGVEYVKLPGDYQPDWQNDFDLAPVRIEVSKQSNENVTNRSCS